MRKAMVFAMAALVGILSACDGMDSASRQDRLNAERPETTTTSTTEATTTTAPPESSPDPAPTAAPGEGATVEQVYDACGQGYATGIRVVPGSTSVTNWDRSIEISQYHMDMPSNQRCWVVAHEDGHAYAMTVQVEQYTALPPGWTYDREDWANCYAEISTGIPTSAVPSATPCPNVELARSLMPGATEHGPQLHTDVPSQGNCGDLNAGECQRLQDWNGEGDDPFGDDANHDGRFSDVTCDVPTDHGLGCAYDDGTIAAMDIYYRGDIQLWYWGTTPISNAGQCPSDDSCHVVWDHATTSPVVVVND